jgi:hypothetical protein
MCFILKIDFYICDCFIGPNFFYENQEWAGFSLSNSRKQNCK